MKPETLDGLTAEQLNQAEERYLAIVRNPALSDEEVKMALSLLPAYLGFDYRPIFSRHGGVPW